MQALIEFIAGLVALLAAAALSQFGVDMHRPSPEREVHRVNDCDTAKPARTMITSGASHDC